MVVWAPFQFWPTGGGPEDVVVLRIVGLHLHVLLLVRVVELRLGLEFEEAPVGHDRVDPLADLVGAEGAVLVVEAVARPVGGGHVELHEVDVLADDVGRRTDLEVVELVVGGDEVGMPELDRVAGIRTEEERLRGADAGDGLADVAPERQEPLLREVPALLVLDHVDLEHGRLVSTRVRLVRVALVADIRARRRGARKPGAAR